MDYLVTDYSATLEALKFSPLRASGFQHLNELVQVDAALGLVQLCLAALELVCRVKEQ